MFAIQPGILYWGQKEGTEDWVLIDFSDPDNPVEIEPPEGVSFDIPACPS